MAGLEAFDLLPEAVLVLDARRVLLHANDRAAALLGTDATAIGRHVGDAVALSTPSGTVCADPVPERGTADRIAERAWTVRLNDGRERGVSMSGRFLDDGRVVLTWRSVRERPTGPDDQADLVAQVSHELRTPLVTIAGFTRSLLERWDDLGDDARRALVEAIGGDARRVGRLLDELLVASRLELGRMPVRAEAVDIGRLATSVVDKARVRPRGRDRDLAVAVGVGVGTIHVDPHRIEQILTNLVENALVHAPQASVQVAVERTDGTGVTVTVSDDGPGIPAHERDRVFDKFDRGGDGHRAGSGLGLFIARGLAEAHGGDLVLASGPEGGARFTLTLPGGSVEGGR